MEPQQTEQESAQLYELGFSAQSEDLTAVKRLLAVQGATVISERPLEKIRFVYPIRKQQYGFLGAIRFSGVADLGAFSKLLGLEGGLIRFMVHRVDAKREAARQESAGRPMGPRPIRHETEPMLTNEALEKKIEEILQ
ncbi:MAG: hypothetical protein AAB601_02745 [Patescibacteria group bacterium]